jgi:prepilin-type N-terminal cleavage/methylation domain-containing protein
MTAFDVTMFARKRLVATFARTWIRSDFDVRVNAAPQNRINRRGISLLEVVLALAILAVASAYLAQSMHIASENASRSESQTQAEIVAESVMNQIIAGVLPNQTVSWTAYTNPNPFGSSAAFTSESQWLYSVSSLSTEVQGMIGVQVAVNEVISGQTDDGQADFFINRWMIDPSLGLDTPPTTDTTDTTGTTSTSGTSSSASSTGGVQ